MPADVLTCVQGMLYSRVGGHLCIEALLIHIGLLIPIVHGVVTGLGGCWRHRHLRHGQRNMGKIQAETSGGRGNDR